MAVAAVGMKVLALLIPEVMPRLKPVQIDGAALGFTLLISVVTGLGFGCAPAWQAGRAKLNEALKQAGAQATAGFGRRRYRSALVVAELALALILLTGAGLMIESVAHLLHVDPGFDPQNLLRVELELPSDKYFFHDRAAQRKVLYAQLHERLAALPGVKAVGVGKGETRVEKVTLEGRKEPVEVLLEGTGVEQCDLFRAMRIPLVAGRYFDQNDIGEGVGTAIINETMSRTFWPGEDAGGKKFSREAWRRLPQYEVVGVVGGFRHCPEPPHVGCYESMNDLRHGFRQLLRCKGTSLLALLILALGVGGTTAVFSVADKLLLNPIPGRDIERLFVVHEVNMMSRFQWHVSPQLYQELASHANLVESLTYFDQGSEPKKIQIAEKTVKLRGAKVAPNFFELFGIRPLAGRGFLPDEGAKEATSLSSATSCGNSTLAVPRT